MHLGADAGGGRVHSDAGAGDGQAVPDAGGRRVRHQGAGDGGDGAHRARRGARSATTVEIVGLKDDAEDGGDGRGDVPQDAEGRAWRGTTWGVCCAGIEREDVERGQVLAKPRSITPHTKFESEVYVLKKEEGGRHTPFFKGYRPQFYIRTMDVTGVGGVAGRAWRW